MNPSPAYFAQWTVGENRGVFDWNVSLIIEAIGHPAAQCLRRKPPFVHTDMERMFVVISARADRAQIFEKSFAIPESRIHMTISNPSRAISIPDCFTGAGSGSLDLRTDLLWLCGCKS